MRCGGRTSNLPFPLITSSYSAWLSHQYVQVRAFSDEWPVHDHDIRLPVAGHQEHDAGY